MENFVLLDNLPDTSTFLLNILWDEGKPMLSTELMEAVNQRFSKNWTKREIKQFLDLLVEKDYITAKRKGLKVYYAALSEEDIM